MAIAAYPAGNGRAAFECRQRLKARYSCLNVHLRFTSSRCHFKIVSGLNSTNASSRRLRTPLTRALNAVVKTAKMRFSRRDTPCGLLAKGRRLDRC